MKLTGLLLICLLLSCKINPLQAQTYFTEGSVSLAPTVFMLPNSNPSIGVSAAYDTGFEHFKFAIGFSLAPRSKSDVWQEKAYAYDQPDIFVPCSTRTGFTSFSASGRYYIFNSEETVGSNFYGGLGIGMHMLSKKIFAGRYDKSVYELEDNFLDSFGNIVKRTGGFAALISAGYDYSFESGFGFTSGVSYSHMFMDDDFGDGKYFGRTGVLMVNAGIKYSFPIDLFSTGWGWWRYSGF